MADFNIELDSAVQTTVIKDSEESAEIIVNAVFETIESALDSQIAKISLSTGNSTKALQKALNASEKIGGLTKMVGGLFPMVPNVIPSGNVEGALCGGVNSLVQIMQAMMIKVRLIFVKAKTEVINLGYPGLDAIAQYLKETFEQGIKEYIYENMMKYLGYSPYEVMMRCTEVFQIYRRLKNIMKEKGDETSLWKDFENALAKLDDSLYNCVFLMIIKDDFEEMVNEFAGLKSEMSADNFMSFIDSINKVLDFLERNGFFDDDMKIVSDFSLNSTMIAISTTQLAGVIPNMTNPIEDAIDNNLTGLKFFDMDGSDVMNNHFTLLIADDPSEGVNKAEMMTYLYASNLFTNANISRIIECAAHTYKTGETFDEVIVAESQILGTKSFTFTFSKTTMKRLNPTVKRNNTSTYQEPRPWGGVKLYQSEETSIIDGSSGRKKSIILHVILQLVRTILETIKPVKKLLNNYRTNKRWLRDMCRMQLGKMHVRQEQRKGYDGLFDKACQKNKYYIRSEKCKRIIENICGQKIYNEFILSRDNTRRFWEYLMNHKTGIALPNINTNLETWLWIDINDKYSDGSNGGTGHKFSGDNVLFSSRPYDELSSQILRAMRDKTSPAGMKDYWT